MNAFIPMSFFSLAVALCASAKAADTAAVPQHLAIAREIVENIKPEDNHYRLGGQLVSFPGDSPSGKYAVSADCSGFLLALFERAQYPTRAQMSFLVPGPKRKRPAAEDFVYSIENELGFKRVTTIKEILPGDLLAHAMLEAADRQQAGTTGHVFLLNSLPKEILPRKPVVRGTRQYAISIIDSNREHVGDDDTRLRDPANQILGIGRGTIRIYADANGELVGWARTFSNSTRFFSYSPRFPSDSKLRKAAIGRPVPKN